MVGSGGWEGGEGGGAGRKKSEGRKKGREGGMMDDGNREHVDEIEK